MPKKTILYVDDEDINILLFKTLMSIKYEVITASNGAQGLEMLANHNEVDFVISDMRMPIMTGLEFIKEAQKLYDDKKFFILTGYNVNDEIEAAIENKLITKYWGKPADFDAIDKVLENE